MIIIDVISTHFFKKQLSTDVRTIFIPSNQFLSFFQMYFELKIIIFSEQSFILARIFTFLKTVNISKVKWIQNINPYLVYLSMR